MKNRPGGRPGRFVESYVILNYVKQPPLLKKKKYMFAAVLIDVLLIIFSKLDTA